MTIKTSSGWFAMYANRDSSIIEWSSSTEERFKISLKVTGSFSKRFNWRKVSKYANLKFGTLAFVFTWNNLSSAQSRISFWENSVLPIPAFPVRRIDLGLLSSSLLPTNISWQCLTRWVSLTWPYRRRDSFLFKWESSSTGFLPCCIRRLVNMSSVLTLEMVEEATDLVWNSVCL